MHTDFSFEFDSIHVIESLHAEQRISTGTKLYTDVLLPMKARLFGGAGGPDVVFHSVHTREELLHVLTQISKSADRSPILHFETHGTDEGLWTADRQLTSWEDLREPLTAINRASRMNLLVTLAACRGAALVRSLKPTQQAPVTLIIGPRGDVSNGVIMQGFQRYYETLLERGDAGEAFTQLRMVESGGAPAFDVRPARMFFAMVLGRHHEIYLTNEAVETRLDELMPRVEGSPAWLVLGPHGIRERLRRDLLDKRRWVESFKRTFFMLDLFPENRHRFDVTVEECEEMARAQRE